MLRLVAAAAIAVGLAGSTASARVDADEPLAFYPQAGMLGQDLFVNNFVDVDAGPSVVVPSDGRLRGPAATVTATAG